jgi:GNAT superfamily N-acetyltransferase
MTQQIEFQIEPYRHDHDAGLAEMWNASDQQWPGGFTRGVPMTAARVADWMDKQVTLLRLVVVTPDGAVVAYGSLWDEPSQPGRTCYVDLLNVHPDYQGRSLCRRMLTQMVDTATAQGYERMTIGTWSANLKAVPLYKKVGFFWKPNTTVSMENYMPLLRRLPILQEFFAEADWYNHFDRELLQVEDEQKHPQTGAMEIYRCRWVRPDGAAIEAVIDRKAQTLTGLETADFAAFAQVATNKPAQGLSYPVTWTITNKRSTPLPVRLAATGDQSIQIDHQAEFTLRPGETRTVTSAYRCAGDAPRLDISQWRPKPTPQIKTLLVLDEEEVTLGSGLHYEPAAEISTHPQPITLTPGVPQRVLVQVKNHLDRAMQGELQIVTADGITVDWRQTPFQADAKGYASVEVELTAAQEGEVALALVAQFTQEGEVITTAPQPLPVLVRSLGSVVAIEHQADAAKRTLYAENDFFTARCHQREGRFSLTNKAGSEYHFGLQEVLGPPYTPSEFDGKDFALHLRREQGRICFASTIVSTAFAGLRLRREIWLTASPVVEVRWWLENEGDLEQRCKVLIGMNFPDSFAVNGQSVMPRRERLLAASTDVVPEAEGDFPKEPAGLSEQWNAVEMDGQVHGVVWGQAVSEHEWRPWFFDLFSTEQQIPVGSSVALEALYLYCGPGDWRTVRRIWLQRNGQTRQEHLKNKAMPAVSDVQQVTLTPNPVLTMDDQVTLQLQADNLRQQPIQGRLQLIPPAGWTIDQPEFALTDLQHEKPFAATVALHATEPTLGVNQGELLLETTGFDRKARFTILRVGDRRAAVKITEEAHEGQPLWQIDNGRMTWSVAPMFNAGIVAWHEAGSATNHLYTAFPNDGEFQWLKPWFGGIRPILVSHEGGFPGKLHQEAFTIAPLQATDAQGLPWHGVRLQADVVGAPSLKGMHAEIDYLTLPGSNLLKAVYRLTNQTPIYREGWNPWGGFMIFNQVDGEYAQSVLYGDNPLTGPVQRKRTAYSVWLNGGNWAAVVNPRTGRALSVSCPSHPESIRLMDAGASGGHLIIRRPTPYSPHGTNELVVYAALVDSLTEAEGFAMLGANKSNP